MIVQLRQPADVLQKRQIISVLQNLGYTTQPVRTHAAEYIVCIGSAAIDIRRIGALPGVGDVFRVSDTYKLVSRKWKTRTSVIRLGDEVSIGSGTPVMIAGPCSIEHEDQVRSIVSHLKQSGIRIMRGGAFKPRSSPYAFQGLGLNGLKLLYRTCKEQGIYVISEVMEIGQIDQMYDYVDIFQVGARNTQNFNLLKALGSVDKPVLLKRGISGSIDELLQSAEYIFSSGNEEIMLCERGIRSFENAYRNTFDINAIPLLKAKSHLPVIADPSHGIGIREHVPDIALAAIVAGADGVMYEVHEQPEEAASDAQQTLNFEESARMQLRAARLIQAMQDSL
jgi:3-deoxy-7-phosphoheptulonate synthase